MSWLTDRLATAGVEQLQDRLGVSATYTPVVGAASTVTVVLIPKPDATRWEQGGQFTVRQCEAVLSIAVTPARNDTLTVGADEWTIEDVLQSDAGHHRVLLARPERQASGPRKPYLERTR